MALNFPANPVDGQVYSSYIYSSITGAWQGREESKAVSITSPVAPTSATPGDLWINSSDGTSFVYYSDGDSAQWIEILPSGGGAGGSSLNVSQTQPSNPVDGDSWFNPVTAILKVYSETYAQWIEVKANTSEIATINSRLATLEANAIFPIQLNTQTISANYSIPSGYNGVSAGPITIANNVVVTIPDGSSWSIV